MNDMEFFNSFLFQEINLRRYRHNDITNGCERHYLGFLKCGTGTLISENERIEVNPGELFYIPKGCKYHSYWRGEDEIRFASIGFSYFPLLRRRYCLQKIEYGPQERPLLEQLTENPSVSTVQIGRLYHLLGLVQSNMLPEPESALQTIVNVAIAYMNRCPSARMHEVAAACKVSETSLYLAFRTELGKTPNTIRHELLCKRAEELLTTTMLSVENISDRLGFSSSSYFRKVFFSITKKTPRQVRKEARAI